MESFHKDKYVWDEEKELINIEKHDVTFREASTVFDDDNAVYVFDETHSKTEERFIVIGMSENLKMLMVCHCYRNGDALIRIISARKAVKKEVAYYAGRKGNE